MGDKIGSGSLRAVTPKTEKHPSYKGSITINDTKFWLSGWRRMGEDGKPWLSLAVERAEDQPAKPKRTYEQRRDFDDEIPF
jgi:hypothetical protein